MLPQRERIVRKAKERIIDYSLSNFNKSANDTLSTTPSQKRNNRSYKPFITTATTNTNGDLLDEQNNDDLLNTSNNEFNDTPPKKSNKNQTISNTLSSRRNTKTQNVTKNAQKTNKATNRLRDTNNTNNNNDGGDNDQLETFDNQNQLFNQIYMGQVSMQSIVDDWIELYKKDKDTAMIDLIKFLIRCSGCKAQLQNYLSKDILKTKEFTDFINDLVEYFTNSNTNKNDDDNNNNNDENNYDTNLNTNEIYPLIQTSLPARRFKSNFGEFLQLLINQCQYSIIYDQFMLDILISFLIGLADSQVRAFRHTATLAVLKITTALVDVLLALSIAKDACQRQHENERKKTQQKRANDRIDMLISKRKELEENETDIQNFINFIFKAVFIHRYRDVCSDIRCVCINEIGEWMKRCPNKFLDDTFLKYIGWTLYDRVGECRTKCLQVLQPLYDKDDLNQRLELFTSRFKTRIVEMCLDKEYEVCVCAIKLLTKIISKNDLALEDKDCENIYELVFHTNRQIAHAAGEFLNQKLFLKVDINQNETAHDQVLSSSSNASFILLLIQFLTESELHDHPTYLVDAMWDIHPMLKDWECMTNLLLLNNTNTKAKTNDENSLLQQPLDDLQERYLVEIINCCVKQAATGEYPIARRTQNRKLTVKENKQVQDDRVLLTQHFITTIADLLTKYIADADKLVFLLQIPTYFDLNQYTLRRQEKHLEKLLKLIQEIIGKHNNSQVLEECSKCLAYLCDEDSSIYVKSNLLRAQIMDDLVQSFTHQMNLFDQLTEVDETEMFPLIQSVKRLTAFAESHTITQYNNLLANNTLTILKWAVYNEGFSYEFVSKAMSLARSIITWNLNKLITQLNEQDNNIDDNNDNNTITSSEVQDLIDYIAKLNKKFFKLCSKLFVNENSQIELEAYFEMCDILVLFNTHLAQQHKKLNTLVLECTLNDMNMLSMYVNQNVFNDDALKDAKADTPETIERLHKRRSILAAFAKLISFNCVPITYAAEIFRGYIKYSHAYMDIIKHLLSTCRDISKVSTAKTIVLALQREYADVVNNILLVAGQTGQSPNQIDRSSSEFLGLKELSHRFCLSFGPEASIKSREAIVTIHYEAIKYANESNDNSSASSQSSSSNKNNNNNMMMAPPNLLFLEVILEFSSRLTSNDKRSVLAELDKTFAKRANKIESNNWHSYYAYRISLMEDQHQKSLMQAALTVPTVASGLGAAAAAAADQTATTAAISAAAHKNVRGNASISTTSVHNSTTIIASSQTISTRAERIERRAGLRGASTANSSSLDTATTNTKTNMASTLNLNDNDRSLMPAPQSTTITTNGKRILNSTTISSPSNSDLASSTNTLRNTINNKRNRQNVSSLTNNNMSTIGTNSILITGRAAIKKNNFHSNNNDEDEENQVDENLHESFSNLNTGTGDGIGVNGNSGGGNGVMILNSASSRQTRSSNSLIKTKMLNNGTDLAGISLIENTNNDLKSTTNPIATTSHTLNNKRSRSPLVPTINNNLNSIELLNTNSNNYNGKNVLSSTRIETTTTTSTTNIGATTSSTATTSTTTNKSSIGIIPITRNSNASSTTTTTDQLLDMTDIELFNDENQQESMPKRKRLSSNPEQDSS